MIQNTDSAGDKPGGAGAERAHPAFLDELVGTLSVHAQYVLYGNIRDRYLVRHPTAGSADGVDKHHSLVEVLWNHLRDQGYQALIRYDAVSGFEVVTGSRAQEARGLLPQRTARRTERRADESDARALAELAQVLPDFAGGWQSTAVADQTGRLPEPLRAVLIVDYAARLATDPTRLSEPERDFFLAVLRAADHAKPIAPGRHGARSLYNPVIWLAERDRDLPVWLTAGSGRIRTVAVPMPDLGDRKRMATLLKAEHEQRSTGTAPRHGGGVSTWETDPISAFTKAAGGMSLNGMRESLRMALDRGMPFSAMPDAVQIYQLGVEDNPWRRRSMREQLKAGEQYIANRVRGQQEAVSRAMDVLKRAALGLSGAQAAHSGSRPRGVLFLAGPTGTGKTELAKAIAQVLFGRDDSYLRFDMSEFSAPHSVDRLVGAPPGYVGYEAGGELTRAVRTDPFRVILFDEIDKAHKDVLDKFLQVLEDGRLTDGQGVTTYFSECVIIFTSNLGIVIEDKATGEKRLAVDPEMKYPKLAKTVEDNVRAFFVEQIGRPELMNRLGGNVIVFNFISPNTAVDIFDQQVGHIRRRLGEEHGVRLELSGAARTKLAAACTGDPLNGGRGIGMKLETLLINPLARELFDVGDDVRDGATVTVADFHQDGNGMVKLQVALASGSPADIGSAAYAEGRPLP